MYLATPSVAEAGAWLAVDELLPGATMSSCRPEARVVIDHQRRGDGAALAIPHGLRLEVDRVGRATPADPSAMSDAEPSHHDSLRNLSLHEPSLLPVE